MLAHAEAFLEKADGTNIDSILPRRYELILSMVSELPIDTETNKIYRPVAVPLIAPRRLENGSDSFRLVRLCGDTHT